MIEKEIKILNRAGMHTRPAATIVKMAAKYKSDFSIQNDDMIINGKSIISVMTLIAPQGSKMKLIFEGEDEKEAAEEIIDYFERGFDEL